MVLAIGHTIAILPPLLLRNICHYEWFSTDINMHA